jgi:hypothetical protein
MQLSGHETASIDRRYRIVDEQDLADALIRTHQHAASPARTSITPLRPQDARS